MENLKLALIINFKLITVSSKKGVVRTNHGRGKQDTRKEGEKGGRGRLLFTFCSVFGSVCTAQIPL